METSSFKTVLTDSQGLQVAVEVIEAGEVIALPTDTVYGLGVKVGTQKAVQKIYDLKTRPSELVLPVLIGRPKDYRSLVSEWSKIPRSLAARFWPGPLTLVVDANEEFIRDNKSDQTIGIRCPDSPFVRKLCKQVGPLFVTSANKHGQPPATSEPEVRKAFLHDRELSLIVDGGICSGEPSTVVDARSGTIECIREGAIPWSWIEASLR